MPTPLAIRITRLVSRPGHGPELAERCRRIAERERAKYPGAYHVIQGRLPLDGDRVELVSITEWYDLQLMARLMPPDDVREPAFFAEYADLIEDWRVEALEVTWPRD